MRFLETNLTIFLHAIIYDKSTFLLKKNNEHKFRLLEKYIFVPVQIFIAYSWLT